MKISKQNKKIDSCYEDNRSEISPFQGIHILLELYGCNRPKLDDESYLRCVINNASKLANAKVINLISNKFEPQGVTAIALLAESHLSIHTWPESNYAAIDIFTCGKNMRPNLAIKFLIDSLDAKDHISKNITRNLPNTIEDQARNSF